jgi:uncharacterized protein with ParB-like and HNH nuclease domain
MAGASSADGKIDIEQISVAKVLSSYWLQVPAYQRDYAWEKGEVQAFLDDITVAITNDEPNYFLGTIVTIRQGDDTFEVVDGQQRLATTALTLAAMGKSIGTSNENFRQLITEHLTRVNSDTLEKELKMTLNIGDNPIFESLILSGSVGEAFNPLRPSHIKLRDAYELAEAHFKAAVSSQPTDAKVTWLKNWFRYIQFNTSVILMKVGNDGTAFRMFETLNDRGIEVSRADLIKNYVFGKAGTAIAQVQGSWAAIRETVESGDSRDSLMNFIWHVLIVTTGTVEQKAIYERVKSEIVGKQKAISVLAEWAGLSKLYIALENPENTQWASYPVKIQSAIKALNLLNIQPFKPLLLAIAKKFKPNEAALAFNRIVAIGVRLLIASRTTTQTVWAPLSETAHKVWKGDIADTKAVVAALGNSIPSDSAFKTAFETATVSKAALARYYLRALHSAEVGTVDPSLEATEDPDKLNLEHVLPTNRMDNWPQFTADEAAAFTKRIGNLALLQTKINSDSKSDSFADKKTALSESKIPTTSMIGKEEIWNAAAIENRQKYLAELALKAWPLK